MAPVQSELPPPNTKRWVVQRKAAVVAAVQSGNLTLEEACRRYELSKEELLAWQRAFGAHGLSGLRATRRQDYQTFQHYDPVSLAAGRLPVRWARREGARVDGIE